MMQPDAALIWYVQAIDFWHRDDALSFATKNLDGAQARSDEGIAMWTSIVECLREIHTRRQFPYSFAKPAQRKDD
jgi:hypothetical protein